MEFESHEVGISQDPSSAADPGNLTEGKIAQLASLIDEIETSSAELVAGADEAAAAADTPVDKIALSAADENRLIVARLGVASSLYTALHWKHQPTAQHCLRASLCCSAWASLIGLPSDVRDEIELASLLHDVGKIGIPDFILCKPGKLTPQESAVIESHWIMGAQILQQSCVNKGVLDTLAYARSWYDGSRSNGEHVGDAIPLGARMLSIVDAFDSMTTDHPYRRALSRERAFEELYRFAGTQFDPELVNLFSQLCEGDQLKLQEAVANRWLHQLDATAVNATWKRNDHLSYSLTYSPEVLFQQKLLDNMHDAVVFVDANLRVILWNRGAERLTGISGESMYQKTFIPSLLRFRDEQGRLIKDNDCPVAHSMRTGVQWLRRLSIVGRSGREVSVDAHAVPVVATDGIAHGLTLLLHDVSPEISLEERCQSLHEMATKDPLTQVANRAEFDRMHGMFVAAHRESSRPCSLIMCDIDHFKRINDTYGHQAGDEAIQTMARVLKSSCRQGDLVARYGGEEFVMLCADCNNAAAARRAEEIRVALTQISHPSLNGETYTASFGVTEIQPGDTPQTMLNRSDRALYTAKESGRNRVVQLGIGNVPIEEKSEPQRQPTAAPPSEHLLEVEMSSESPLARCIDKLRGFIADHDAEIVKLEGDHVRLRIESQRGQKQGRRATDRPIRLIMDLHLRETCEPTVNTTQGPGRCMTVLHVKLTPVRSRDRRQAAAFDRARQLVISLRAYVMATETSPIPEFQAPPAGGWLTRLTDMIW